MYLAFIGPKWSGDAVFIFPFRSFLISLTLDDVDHVQSKPTFYEKKH